MNVGVTDDPAWVIAAERGLGFSARLAEAWRYRRLLAFFMMRTIETLIMQSRFGWLYLIIRPAAPVLTAAFVYGSVMNVTAGDSKTPYFLFFATGTLAWNFLDGPWMWGSRGLELHRHLIVKMYFPRIILPIATSGPGLVDTAVISGIVLLSLVYHRVADGIWMSTPGWSLALAPLLAFQVYLLGLGLAFWTSPWQVRARDVRYGIGYVLGFWFFLTPVIYPLSRIPVAVQWLALINPMTAPVETFRAVILGTNQVPWQALLSSAVVTMAVLLSGVWHFARMEARAVDS